MCRQQRSSAKEGGVMSVNFGFVYNCPKCEQNKMYKVFAQQYIDESDIEYCTNKQCNYFKQLETKFNKLQNKMFKKYKLLMTEPKKLQKYHYKDWYKLAVMYQQRTKKIKFVSSIVFGKPLT